MGNYTITTALGTLAAQNYTFSFASGTLSVTPATLTVTANNGQPDLRGVRPGVHRQLQRLCARPDLGRQRGYRGPEPDQHRHRRQPGGQLHDHRRGGHAGRAELHVQLHQRHAERDPGHIGGHGQHASRTYGASDPAYTASYSGFVLSQTLGDSGVTGAPSLTSNDTAASPVGSYTITAALGTLAAANYTFSFANGTLSVTPATLTVTANPASRTYGASDPGYTASYSGFVLSQTLGDSGVTGAPSLTSNDSSRQPGGHVHDHRRPRHAWPRRTTTSRSSTAP